MTMFIYFMITELKTKFPWITEKNTYTTIGTDDYDSFVLWNLLREVNNWELNYFYSFNKLYKLDLSNTSEAIGCDLSVPRNKTIDNHVQMLFKNSPVNNQSINLNNIYAISGDNYFTKYAMSSTLTGWWALDVPLPKSELGKMFLIALDSGHKGFYNKDGKYRKEHTIWLERMGYTELIDILHKHPQEHFDTIVKEMKTKGDFIKINSEGFMETGTINLDNLSKHLDIKLELPSEKFTLARVYETGYFNKYKNPNIQLDKSVISYALTYKDNGAYTYKIS